ncbi:MAG TPA: peptidase inhibitor family I36 protein [Pilimelia sp.]|nr:peptidase inhibitor family I36 protein [Pilimelia sp.]
MARIDRRRARRGAAVVAAVLLWSPTVAAPPAAAAPADRSTATYGLSDCPDNYMCAWEHAYHQGKYIYLKTGCYDFNSCFASPFRDKATSLWNRTPYDWCFYTSTNLSGGRYEVASGALIDNVGAAWNDQFESAHRC